jgi:hypothetical protein
LIENIDNIVANAFKIRHQVMHDANFYMDFDSIDIAKTEDCLIVFPQFIAIWLIKRYHQKRLVFNRKEHYERITDTPSIDEHPVIVGPKDFKAKDYNLVE